MLARLRPVAVLLGLLNVFVFVNALAIPSSQEIASRSHRRTLQIRKGSSTNDLLTALRDAKLTKLAALLNDNPTVLQSVDASPGLKTLLAPIDDALPFPTWSNITAVLLYHFLNGTIGLDDYPTLPRHAVVHSFLTDSTGANLPGGNGQAVALSTGETHGTYDEDTRQVNEAINTDAFDDRGSIEQSTIRVGQYTVLPIRRAMTIPGNATFTARVVLRRTAFVEALQKSAVPTDALDLMRGSTVFVPSNAAMASFKQKHGNLSNETLAAILRNHVVAYRAAYSALLTPGASLISMGGQDMHVTNSSSSSSSSSQMRVSVGNASATITQTDVMHYGGVMHLIDDVLVDASYDQQRAEQAASSAQASANSHVAGVVSTSNAASSQGTNVPASPAGSVPAAQNSTVTSSSDASGGNGTINGQGSRSSSGDSGKANAATSHTGNMPCSQSVALLTLAVMAAVLLPHT